MESRQDSRGTRPFGPVAAGDPGDLSDTTPPTSGADSATVLLDTSDLLTYLHHHSVVSGIQRVVAEVLPGLQSRHSVEFVAYSPQSGGFVLLERTAFQTLMDAVRNATEANKSAIHPMVVAIQASLASRPKYSGRQGDVLAVLGAAWIYEGFFRAVAEIKSNGVGVVVLLYDLVPLMFPGFSQVQIMQFRRYLLRVVLLADRVSTISAATRRDLDVYGSARGWAAPPGRVTGLAADQWHPAERSRRRPIQLPEHGIGPSCFSFRPSRRGRTTSWHSAAGSNWWPAMAAMRCRTLSALVGWDGTFLSSPRSSRERMLWTGASPC